MLKENGLVPPKRACVYQLNSTCLVSTVLFYMTRKLRGVRSRLRKRC